jgi:hypothetical protein
VPFDAASGPVGQRSDAITAAAARRADHPLGPGCLSPPQPGRWQQHVTACDVWQRLQLDLRAGDVAAQLAEERRQARPWCLASSGAISPSAPPSRGSVVRRSSIQGSLRALTRSSHDCFSSPVAESEGILSLRWGQSSAKKRTEQQAARRPGVAGRRMEAGERAEAAL